MPSSAQRDDVERYALQVAGAWLDNYVRQFVATHVKLDQLAGVDDRAVSKKLGKIVNGHQPLDIEFAGVLAPLIKKLATDLLALYRAAYGKARDNQSDRMERPDHGGNFRVSYPNGPTFECGSDRALMLELHNGYLKSQKR